MDSSSSSRVGGVIALLLLLLATLARYYGHGYGYTGTNIDLQHDETRLLLLEEDPKTTIDKDIFQQSALMGLTCTILLRQHPLHTHVLSASAFQENMAKCTLPLGGRKQ